MAKFPDARAPFTEPSSRRDRTLDRMLGVALTVCAWPCLTTREYAEEVGASLSSTRYWLGCLFERACVVRYRNEGSLDCTHPMAWLWEATPKGEAWALETFDGERPMEAP